ncbi:hypothetical protein MTR67_046004 [Solanum verrucosum]|uniref:DOG1 domain-containing protein n=1 Tax=Solanum verrucosum TaxID=315347 RepID=A0AAF0UW93_SOLVR|nr:hypothetical protein MTR67_046004 [Solanum verrucosum]
MKPLKYQNLKDKDEAIEVQWILRTKKHREVAAREKEVAAIACCHSAGPLPFDTEYRRWLEEHTKHINELRTTVNSHASDPELRSIVDNAIAHHDEVYRMKANAAKGNVEHLLSGMWKTPAERCFMWIGDFRPSLLLKVTSSCSHFCAILHQFFHISHLDFPCI